MSDISSLREILHYIAKDNLRAATHIEDRIRRTLTFLTYSPFLGRQGTKPGIRELAIANLPLKIIYRVTGDKIEILTIFHTSRDPSHKDS